MSRPYYMMNNDNINMNDYDFWDEPEFMDPDGFNGPGPGMFRGPKRMRGGRNDQYNNAYGDYRGGYGPPGGFGNNWGPPQNFGPPDNFGPPPSLFPPFNPGPPGFMGGGGGGGGGGNFMWGRGYGPGGPQMKRQPSDEKTLKYLRRCGVAKEHLKNLPRDLLQMYDPEYCSLCAQGFDTFAISRMHYISKNHLKNQKKWLTQQSEIGFNRATEIPLKSRDLYCELCDVHITSKVHSESHYAGRPHRAIVEGRKNPRNPFLLQEGMERRLEQLIRREKRHLKPAEEEEIEEKQKVEEMKNTAPELYCEICKTTVTCSEQMTMHLNGKRHLAKEKQHILKMMKGDANANAGADDDGEAEGEEETAQEGGNENGDGEEKGEEEGEGGNDQGDNNFDWGNGSGNWDEPTKVEL